MKALYLFLFLIFSVFSYGQKEFKIISIDSTETNYIIKIQKTYSNKCTTIYPMKPKSVPVAQNKIKVGSTYNFSFIRKYRMGNPELRYDENGDEKFVVKREKFRKNNQDISYTVNELDGLYYSKEND